MDRVRLLLVDLGRDDAWFIAPDAKTNSQACCNGPATLLFLQRSDGLANNRHDHLRNVSRGLLGKAQHGRICGLSETRPAYGKILGGIIRVERYGDAVDLARETPRRGFTRDKIGKSIGVDADANIRMSGFHVSSGSEKHIKTFGRLTVATEHALAEALPVARLKGGDDFV